MRYSRSTFLILASAISLSAPTAFAQGAPAYHVVKKIAAGGEGGWDYLIADTAAERLYVSRGTHVMVVDLKADSVIGDIPNTAGVHG